MNITYYQNWGLYFDQIRLIFLIFWFLLKIWWAFKIIIFMRSMSTHPSFTKVFTKSWTLMAIYKGLVTIERHDFFCHNWTISFLHSFFAMFFLYSILNKTTKILNLIIYNSRIFFFSDIWCIQLLFHILIKQAKTIFYNHKGFQIIKAVMILLSSLLLI